MKKNLIERIQNPEQLEGNSNFDLKNTDIKPKQEKIIEQEKNYAQKNSLRKYTSKPSSGIKPYGNSF